jgi:hypothetical protein
MSSSGNSADCENLQKDFATMIARFEAQKSSGVHPSFLEVGDPSVVQIKLGKQISSDIEHTKITPKPGRNAGDLETVDKVLSSLTVERTYQRYLQIVGSADWQAKMELIVGLTINVATELNNSIRDLGQRVYYSMKNVAFEARFYDAATFDIQRCLNHVLVVGYGPFGSDLIFSNSDTMIDKSGLRRYSGQGPVRVEPVRWETPEFKLSRFDKMSPDGFVYIKSDGHQPAATYHEVSQAFPEMAVIYHDELNVVSRLNHYRLYDLKGVHEFDCPAGRFGGPHVRVPLMSKVLFDMLHHVTHRMHSRMMGRPADLLPTPLPISAIWKAVSGLDSAVRDVNVALFATALRMAWNLDYNYPSRGPSVGLLSMKAILDNCRPSADDLFVEYARHVMLRTFFIPEIHISWGRFASLKSDGKIGLPVLDGVYPGNIAGLVYYKCEVSDDDDAIRSSRVRDADLQIDERKKRSTMQVVQQTRAVQQLEEELKQLQTAFKRTKDDIERVTSSLKEIRRAEAAASSSSSSTSAIVKGIVPDGFGTDTRDWATIDEEGELEQRAESRGRSTSYSQAAKKPPIPKSKPPTSTLKQSQKTKQFLNIK